MKKNNINFNSCERIINTNLISMVRCYTKFKDKCNGVCSDEHIIAASIGGTWKAPNILCKGCNEYLGSTLDKDFEKQFNHLVLGLNIKTRSKAQKTVPMYSNGEETKFTWGLEPLTYIQVNNPDGTSYSKPHIREGDLESIAKQEVQRLEKNGHGKFEFHYVELPSKKESHTFSKDGEIYFDLEIIYRGVCKSCINFLLSKGENFQFTDKIIPFIKGEVKGSNFIKFYYSELYKLILTPNEVSHFLYLKGDAERKILYCYIELFNTWKFLVFLNDDYDGNEIEEKYCYDLLNRKKVNKNYTMNLTREHYEDIQRINPHNQKSYNKFQSLYNRLEKIMGDNQIIY